jgi:thiopeptide-type bacteriocin biosynthesis protein
LQLNIALSRKDRDALSAARSVFSELSDRLPRWRRQRALRCVFFMRKPPDIRLRLLVRDRQSSIRSRLQKIMRQLRSAGAIERYFFSVYEPETNLFGGAPAMRLVHKYFDIDSAGWVALDQFAQSGQRTALPMETVSNGILNDLFMRAVGDSAEVWDIWRNLAVLIRAREQADAARVDRTIVEIEPLRLRASAAEAATLARYAQANRALAEGLRKLQERGSLHTGLRALLAFVAMFHLNRYGFDHDRQSLLAVGMFDAWDPRTGLQGAEPPRV